MSHQRSPIQHLLQPDEWYNHPPEYAISGILIQLPNAPLETASSLISTL